MFVFLSLILYDIDAIIHRTFFKINRVYTDTPYSRRTLNKYHQISILKALYIKVLCNMTNANSLQANCQFGI